MPKHLERGRWRITDQGHSNHWMLGHLWDDEPDQESWWDDETVVGNTPQDAQDLLDLLAEKCGCVVVSQELFDYLTRSTQAGEHNA